MKDFISSYLIEGELCKKDQLLILLGLFSARREEEKLKVVAQLAAEDGITLAQMADLISSAIISRGIPTWLSGMEALQAVAALKPSMSFNDALHMETFRIVEECVHYYQTEFAEVPAWVNYLIDYAPTILLHYSNLRTVALADSQVPRRLKELLLYAINVCDRYPKGIAIHKTNAMQLGATEEI